MADEPRKAYYVERVMRTVASGIVYADSAEDAKRRFVSDGFDESYDSLSEGRGFARVRRVPEEDRRPPDYPFAP